MIAFQVTQPFIRFHLGDALVVMLMHFTLRALFVWPAKRAALCALLLAFAVEGAQAAGLIHLLGLSDSTWARLVMGDTFQWADLLMYLLGSGLAWWIDDRASLSHGSAS
jgi:hypothetical protein